MLECICFSVLLITSAVENFEDSLKTLELLVMRKSLAHFLVIVDCCCAAGFSKSFSLLRHTIQNSQQYRVQLNIPFHFLLRFTYLTVIPATMSVGLSAKKLLQYFLKHFIQITKSIESCVKAELYFCV